MNERERTARAAQRVQDLMGFYIHALAFAAVNSVLFVLNFMQSQDGWWMQWVVFGWGLGVLLHALLVFGRMPAFVTRWQLRKIREARAGS